MGRRALADLLLMCLRLRLMHARVRLRERKAADACIEGLSDLDTTMWMPSRLEPLLSIPAIAISRCNADYG